MQTFLDGVQYVLDLGPTVIIPIAIFIIALIFGVKISKAFTSAITIGIGFVGINLVIGLLSDELGAATQQMVERFGFSLTVLDVGWPTAASAAFASPVAPIMIILILLVNFAMLFLRMTKTLNIDIWNFHHFITASALVYIATDNLIISLLMGIIMEMIVLWFADRQAPMIQEFYGLEGISLTTGSSVAYAIIGMPIAWVIGKIPGIKDIDVKPETIQERFGVFGEPMIMGLVIGFVIGLLAGYDIGLAFSLGVSMGAVLVLMPRMVKLLMEGLMPISEAAQTFADKYFGGREIYIGLDSALSIGHPANASAGLLLVPITLFLAVILPGNKVLPFGDLATIPFYTAYITASRKGNIFHTVLAGTVMIAIGLYLATNMAPEHTEFVAGLNLGEAGAQMSTLDTGGNILKWGALRIGEFIAGLFN